jgi:hypothetical protein
MFGVNFSLDDLVQFLLESRSHGYAGGAEKVANPQRPGFKEFAPFVQGDFEYVDSYAGHFYAPGQEVVRFRGRPVWNMAYNGGMMPVYHGDLELDKRVYSFLKEMLIKGNEEKPFSRGPTLFYDSRLFSYYNDCEGDITNFRGRENIRNGCCKLFQQDYIGGLIIHKQ